MDPDTLNIKQRRFCEEYLKDCNGSAAAIRAGYAESNSRSTANNLLARPDVREYIDARVSELTKELMIEERWILAKLKEESQNMDNPATARINALNLLGKYQSLFTDKVEHSGTMDFNHIERVAVYRNEHGELVEEDLETGEIQKAPDP